MKHLVVLAFLAGAAINPPIQKPLPISAAIKPFKKQLGIINGTDSKVLYYVVTECYLVPAAAQSHGRSSIIFLNRNRAVVAKYEVDLREELPERVIGNTLVFNCKNQTGGHSLHKQLIGPNLPKWVCAAPDNCFHKQQQ